MQSIFLFPLGLAGLALLALPVIVHLLNRRKADMLYFPSLRFITASRTTMLRVHRINNVPLLLLRLLIFAVIVLSAARPFRFPFVSARENEQAIILVDSSASMNAKGRWSEAMRQARSVIEKQPENTRVALLGFDGTGRVITDFTSKSQAIAALDNAIASGWRSSGASMKWAECGQFLNRFLASNSSGLPRVFAISDFQASNFKLDKISSGIAAKIETIDVRGFDHNLSLQFPSLQTQADRLKLRAEISDETKSESSTESKFKTAEFYVPLISGNKPVELLDARSGATLKLIDETGNGLIGTVTGGWSDDLDSDNTVYFALRRPSPVTFAVLHGTNSSEQAIENRKYLDAALSSLPAELANKISEINLADAVKQADRRLIVADFKEAANPESQKLLFDFVRSGGHLWLFGPDPSDAEFINSKLSLIGNVSPVSSVARENSHDVQLEDIFDAALGLQIGESARRQLTSIAIKREIKFVASPQSIVLLRYADGVPALISRSMGRGDVLVWGLPLDHKASSLVTDAAFPLLCQALMKRAGEQSMSYRIDNGMDALRFGSVIRSLGPIKGVDELAGGGDAPANIGELPTWQPGLYKLRAESGDLVIAINQSEEESHPGAATEAQKELLFKPDAAKPESRSIIKEKEESERSLWRYLLLGAVILLAGELAFSFYLGNRPVGGAID